MPAVVDESMNEFEICCDALVREALGPKQVDDSSVAGMSALTDLEVWRTLRDQGATAEAAVERASAAAERWLEARPRR